MIKKYLKKTWKGWKFLFVWTLLSLAIIGLFRYVPMPEVLKMVLQIIVLISLGFFADSIIKLVYKNDFRPLQQPEHKGE